MNINGLFLQGDFPAGSEEWWQEKAAVGIPIVGGAGPQRQVTFLWRDPQGSETQSPIQRVWLYITGITDHHGPATPVCLARVAGTDIWHHTLPLASTWRGSYCLIPSLCTDDFPPGAFDNPPQRQALREGWRKLLPHAQADSFNPDSWCGGRGHATSALHLPAAPAQPGWDNPAASWPQPQKIHWSSTLLANRRRVWLFAPGDAPAEQRPLAILLDGQFWATQMPIWPALQAQTLKGDLPPALYLMIDVVDNDTRSCELPCNPAFWQAVEQELLPLVRQHTHWREDAATTLAVGQSFGGLAALYGGLYFPELIGGVLSQSGSYWWPRREEGEQPGWLTTQIQQSEVGQRAMNIFLEAGIYEPLIHRAHQGLVPLLQQPQHRLCYRQVEGGHDALCWRGGLIAGLRWLWAPYF